MTDISLISYKPKHKYVCQHCEKTYKSRSGLKSHIENKHEQKKYPCKLCNKVYLSANALKAHDNFIHKGINHPCTGCDVNFMSAASLELHKAHYCKFLGTAGNNKVSCHKCNLTMYKVNLRRHLNYHCKKNKPVDDWKCPHCLNVYNARRKESHIKRCKVPIEDVVLI
jgi:hypothetical protein